MPATERARLLTWLAVAALAGAAFAIPGMVDAGGIAFDGLFVADSFAAFSKILIYIAAAVSLVAASGWFSRDGDYRAEYPVLILLSSVGMGMMVSAGDLLTLYVGLELQSLAAYVLASFQRRDDRSAEAGLKYFVLGALACGILLYGISLLYGFTGSTLFGEIARRARPRRSLDRRAVRHRLRPGRNRLQGLGGAVPHVDSGRLRGRADAGHRLLRLGAQGRGDGPAHPGRGRGDGAGHVRMAPDRHLHGARLDHPRRSRRDRPAQHQAAARLQLDQQCRLRPDRPRRRAPATGVASVLFYMAVYIVMTLGSFLVVLRMRDSEGRPVESIASLSGLSTHPALAGGGHGDLHVQPGRRAAAVRLLAQVPGLRRGGAGRTSPGSPRSASPPR